MILDLPGEVERQTSWHLLGDLLWPLPKVAATASIFETTCGKGLLVVCALRSSHHKYNAKSKSSSTKENTYDYDQQYWSGLRPVS